MNRLKWVEEREGELAAYMQLQVFVDTMLCVHCILGERTTGAFCSKERFEFKPLAISWHSILILIRFGRASDRAVHEFC